MWKSLTAWGVHRVWISRLGDLLPEARFWYDASVNQVMDIFPKIAGWHLEFCMILDLCWVLDLDEKVRTIDFQV